MYLLWSMACICMLASTVFGQEKKLKLSRSDSKNINVSSDILKKASQLVDKEPLKAIDLLSGYLLQNTKSGNRAGEAEAYMLIGRANYFLRQYDLALENYYKANRPAINTKRKFSKSNHAPPDRLYYHIGEVFMVKKEWDSAVHYLQLFVSTQSNTVFAQEHGRLALGRAYLGVGKYKLATQQAELVAQLASKTNNLDLQAESLLLKGMALDREGDEEAALKALYDALEYNGQRQENELGKNIVATISETLTRQNKPAQALDFKKQRLSQSIAEKDLSMQNALNYDIAQSYIAQNQPREAVPYLNQSVELSEQTGDLTQNIKARKSLSDLYAEEQNYTAALENYKQYVALFDKLYKEKQDEITQSSEVLQDLYRNQETINLLEKDRQLSENQIELLEKDRALKEESIARQSILIYALVAFIALMLTSGLLLYRNMRQKRIANQLLALKSLRSQMNPHFIFNALNSVNSFISKNDTRQANKYLTEFSRLMRTVMENSQEDFVPLAEEIEVLSLYLKLEHFRFQDKFAYELVVSPNISTEDYRIPPMLIQPYIENAIWHGLRYRQDVGFLSVSVGEDEHALLLGIIDNGIGRTKSRALKTSNQQQNRSTGMKNTENRVELLNNTFNSKISITISDLTKDEHTGTKVMVRIPKPMILQPC